MLRAFGAAQNLFSGQRPIATLGVFDGVHRGHAAVIAETVLWARERHAPAIVITFDVHPRSRLALASPPAITSLEHRLRLFERLGLNAAVILPFDSEMASLAAEEFVQRWLASSLHIQGIVVGYDAHFGAGRSGNFPFLEQIGQRHGFTARAVPPIMIEGKVISSTAIRAAVAAGDLRQAEAMLGRPVSVLGTVVTGKGLGRRLGFPTLNLDLHHELHPPAGVYIGEALWGNSRWPAAVNISCAGDNHGEAASLVEAHLLDFHGDLYSQTVEISILEHMRTEQKFSSLEALRAQISIDVENTRRWFARHRQAGA